MTIHKVLIDPRKISPERILEIAKLLKHEAEEQCAREQSTIEGLRKVSEDKNKKSIF